MAAAEPQSGDLRATLALSQDEAQRGTTRTLTLPGGRLVTVSVPAGIRTGQEIRLEGQGQPTSNGPAGALILTVLVTPAENFGYQPYSLQGVNAPTEFIQSPNVAPPPPPMAQQSYPGKGPAGSYTNYPPYSQQPAQAYQDPYAPYPPYAQGQQPGTQRPRRRSAGLTILLVILALLVVGGGLLIYYSAVYQPNQLHAQATGTALAQVTGTGAANATGTAQATATTNALLNATATSQAQATATLATYQNDYNQITHSTPTLNDPLTGPDSYNWDAGNECSFTGGAYHVTETQKGFFLYCTAKATNFSNFAYQVQMKILKGDFGGITFRADTANAKYYLMRIGVDGAYNCYLYPNNKATDAKTLLSGSTTLFHTGYNQVNQVAVIVRGSTFNLYINGQYVDSASDSTLSAGQIGVIAEYNTQPAEVVYSQAQVWSL